MQIPFTKIALAAAFGLAALPALGQHKHPISLSYYLGRKAVSNEVIVKLVDPRNAAGIKRIEADEDIDATEGIGDGSMHLLHSRSKNIETLIKRLEARDDVQFVSPNYMLHADTTPNDTNFGMLWGLQNTGQTVSVPGKPGADISATKAWDITTGSRSTVVTVIDTGINYNHPDLAANIWSAPRSFTVTIGGTTMTVPAGSHGFNSITNTFDPMDDHDHGTHCSGTIGGVGNNGVGVAGVNWTASIMGCKFLDSTGNGSTANAINCIEFAIQAKQQLGADANVRVLSNSWSGGGADQALLDEINKANTANMLFVAAAGNSNSNNDVVPSYPSSYTAANILAVAATDNQDARASFSSYGATSVDLGAPGVNVLSTVRSGYAYFSGTSMATPHVAGAAALVLSVNPNLTTAQLKTILMNNVDPIASMAGVTVTGGRLNVFKAVQAAGSSPNPDFTLGATPSSRSITQGSSTTFTVDVTGQNGYSGTVALSVGGLPAGATPSFSPSSVAGSGSSTLTITTTNAVPVGNYLLTISGSDGTLSHSSTVTLSVTAAASPDFTVGASPTSRSVARGGSTTYTVSVASLNGFGGTVGLSVVGLPNGATATFSPTSVVGGGSSVLTVKTAANTPKGVFTLTLRGTSGATVHSATVTLQVKQK